MLPHTDYAILINGSWGCGKTYFWKNMVEPKLKEDKKNLLTPLYASFYGCENIKDVDTQLFFASYPKIKGKLTCKLSTAGCSIFRQAFNKFTKYELPSINLRWFIKKKNTVICFDDLERSNLPFKEILGYINTFVEHEGAKVIILCNEKAIEDKKDLEIYRKMKEKVVGNSLNYQPDYKSVLSTLTDEYKDQKEFYDFLSNNTELILHLFNVSETNNLRALRRAITSLNMVFETIKEGDIAPNKLTEQIIYAVMPTAFELYGHGVEPEWIKKIHNMNFIYLSTFMNLNPPEDVSDDQKYEHKFINRYFNIFDIWDCRKAVNCPPICEFMITGFLDKTSLLEWARELTIIPDENQERINRLTTNPRELTDEEFNTTTSMVLHDVESGNIADIKTYLSLYRVFDWFAKDSLIPGSQDQITEKFKRGLVNAQEAGRLESNRFLESDIEILLKESETEKYQAFCKYILEVNKSIVESQKRNHILELTANLQDNPDAFIEALSGNNGSGFLLKPIFHELDVEKISQQILSLPNALKMRFGSALHERYVRYQPQSEYLTELPALVGIRDAIKYHCDESVKASSVIPMSLCLEQDIVKVLDQTIDRLEKFKNHGENK